MIAVSAVSLLLIVTLTTVTLTQCLLIIRMKRSRDRSETYAEATNPITKTTDVPVSLNEAYALTNDEEVTYELVFVSMCGFNSQFLKASQSNRQHTQMNGRSHYYTHMCLPYQHPLCKNATQTLLAQIFQ